MECAGVDSWQGSTPRGLSRTLPAVWFEQSDLERVGLGVQMKSWRGVIGLVLPAASEAAAMLAMAETADANLDS